MRLKDGASLHELPAYYHADLLPPAGRALLSIRLASGLRSDFVAIEGRSCRAKVQGIYASLGPIGMGLESMHPFFAEWREHSEEREREREREQERQRQRQQQRSQQQAQAQQRQQLLSQQQAQLSQQ